MMLIKNNILISIIVPVYRVEQYLPRCIDSIINQTYKDLEIILVDDGSPDNCGAICDSYALIDKRIKVIHKENGGLSSARNTGLQNVHGDYIGFVDSDDWIEESMYESLLNGFHDSEIGVVACGVKEILCPNLKGYNSFASSWNKKDTIRLNYFEMLNSMIVNESLCPTVWNKLYKKELIKDVIFYEGRNNEDTFFNYQVVKKLKKDKEKILIIPDVLYNYVIRDDGIARSGKKPLAIDAFENLIEIKADCQNFEPGVCPNLQNKANIKCLEIKAKLLDANLRKTDWYKYYDSILRKIRLEGFLNDRMSMREKVFLTIYASIVKYCPILYKPIKKIIKH